MTPENEVPTEDALFDNAVDGTQSPEPSPAPAPAPAPSPAPAEKPAPEQPKPGDAIAAKPEGDPEDFDANGQPVMVPRSRIRGIDKEKRAAEAERDAIKAELEATRRERDRVDFERQEYQRRANTQPKPEAKEPDFPDPLLDPNGFAQYLKSDMKRQVDERLHNERSERSLQSARKANPEEFDQAYQAAIQLKDAGLWARMQQTSDAGETLIGWFRDLKWKHEVGNDLTAYKKRLREEALKDPEYRKLAMETWGREASATQPDGRPHIQLAPSLNGVSRSNAALRASQTDLPDDALFDATTQA